MHNNILPHRTEIMNLLFTLSMSVSVGGKKLIYNSNKMLFTKMLEIFITVNIYPPIIRFPTFS